MHLFHVNIYSLESKHCGLVKPNIKVVTSYDVEKMVNILNKNALNIHDHNTKIWKGLVVIKLSSTMLEMSTHNLYVTKY